MASSLTHLQRVELYSMASLGGPRSPEVPGVRIPEPPGAPRRRPLSGSFPARRPGMRAAFSSTGWKPGSRRGLSPVVRFSVCPRRVGPKEPGSPGSANPGSGELGGACSALRSGSRRAGRFKRILYLSPAPSGAASGFITLGRLSRSGRPTDF